MEAASRGPGTLLVPRTHLPSLSALLLCFSCTRHDPWIPQHTILPITPGPPRVLLGVEHTPSVLDQCSSHT